MRERIPGDRYMIRPPNILTRADMDLDLDEFIAMCKQRLGVTTPALTESDAMRPEALADDDVSADVVIPNEKEGCDE